MATEGDGRADKKPRTNQQRKEHKGQGGEAAEGGEQPTAELKQ